MQEFTLWIRKQVGPILFFDGALKSNPRVAREGGVILYLDESRENCAWWLGRETNNQEEQWSLWMGLTMLKNKGICLIQMI